MFNVHVLFRPWTCHNFTETRAGCYTTLVLDHFPFTMHEAQSLQKEWWSWEKQGLEDIQAQLRSTTPSPPFCPRTLRCSTSGTGFRHKSDDVQHSFLLGRWMLQLAMTQTSMGPGRREEQQWSKYVFRPHGNRRATPPTSTPAPTSSPTSVTQTSILNWWGKDWNSWWTHSVLAAKQATELRQAVSTGWAGWFSCVRPLHLTLQKCLSLCTWTLQGILCF